MIADKKEKLSDVAFINLKYIAKNQTILTNTIYKLQSIKIYNRRVRGGRRGGGAGFFETFIQYVRPP